MDFLPNTQKQKNKNNNYYDHQMAAWLFFQMEHFAIGSKLSLQKFTTFLANQDL